MDEPNTPQDDSASKSGQVMDIQTPKSPGMDNSPTMEAPAPPAMNTMPMMNDSSPASSMESPAMPYASEPAPASSGMPSSEPSSSLNDMDSAGSSMSDMPPENPMAVPPHMAGKHAGTPVIAVVIAVVVALALAGGVVYMYLKSNTATKPSSTTTTSQTTVKPGASVSDVDTTNQEIDDNLSKTDDTKDFANTDLSDTSLGL